jgi:hypothetical protein
MNKIKLLLFSSVLFLNSCKGQNEIEPSFEKTAENEVNIKVSEDTKNALEYLANSPIKISSQCNGNKERQYNIDFYFKINQESKDLIIIEYFSNPCAEGEASVNRKITKYTIPFQKIKDVDIRNYENFNVDESNKNIRKLFITMEYNTNSIVSEYTESRIIEPKKNFFSSKTIKENLIILEIPMERIQPLKEIIEYLSREFK